MTDAPAAKRPSLPKQIQLFGEYVLDAEIEEGPTWAVYSAHHMQLQGNRFLVRVLRGMNAMRRNVVEGFARQALLLESLRHPGIVPLAAAGVDQGVVFIIKPYITGISLANKLADGAEVEPSELLRIVRETAEALSYLHRHSPRVIHRALDISKILLEEPDGHVRVLEVGYAQALDEVARVEPLENLPRPADGFQAPDDVIGTDADPSVDQYSLAAVARECIAHCGAATSAVEEAARPVIARAMSSTPAARFPDVLAFSQALHDAIVPLTRPGVRIIPGDPNAAPQKLSRSFVPRPTPSNPRLAAQIIPKPIANVPAVPPPSVVAARAPEPHEPSQPMVAPRPPPAPPGAGRKRTAIFGSPPVPDPEPTEPDGVPVAAIDAIEPASSPSVAPSPVTPTWNASTSQIIDPPVALPPPPNVPASISDSWTVDVDPSQPAATAPLATVPLDFDDESRPRATAAAVPAAVAAARASSRPPPRAERLSERPRVQTVPPRPASVAPPPSASVRPPARTSVAKSAVFIGVSMVLASAIYTVGFMLRPALMQLAFAPRAAVVANTPVAETHAPTPPTPITNAADVDSGTASVSDATVAAVPAIVVDASEAVDASGSTAIAMVAPVVDAAAAEPADASAATNTGGSAAVPTSVDAGTTPTETVAANEPMRPHPGFHERHEIEDQAQQRIDQCPGHVGRHARINVTYAGPTGAVGAIVWNGTAPDMVPVQPCIEAAVRAFPVHPFTEPTWTTDFVFAVH